MLVLQKTHLIICSDNGWITSELSVKCVECFLSNTPDDGEPRLLILGDHSMHTYNIKFLELTSSRKVEVVCFPAHATYLLLSEVNTLIDR